MRISDWSSDVCSSDLNTRSVVARFQGTYSFTDISGIAPFKIIPAGDGSFTFDRGDGHREPLYASGEGLVGPDRGIILNAMSPANVPAGIITYTRLGGSGASQAERLQLEERRVGKEFVRPCSSGVAPSHINNIKKL